MLDNISTRQDWFQEHSKIGRCLKNLELFNRLLDQKLIDFDERNNSHEKYDVATKTEQKFEALFQRHRTDLESHESRTSEGEILVRELRTENMQLQASAVPPEPTRDSVIQDLRFGMNRQEA